MNKIAVAMEKWQTYENENYYMCTLTNAQGVVVEILSFGALIRRWLVPSATGLVDIVQGKDQIADYKASSSCSSLIVGRFANRIREGIFTLNGKTYDLEKNSHGNTLHSASGNYATKNWEMHPFVKDDLACVTLKVHDYGQGGFPGEADMELTYSLDNEGTLSLDYKFTPTAATPVNLTCHAYFNLNGHETDNLENHMVQILADTYLPGDVNGLATGEILPVEGTDMDLRKMTELAPRLASKHPQIVQFDGYDNNYCANGEGMRLVASAIGTASGLRMDTYTDLPGVQLYTTNIGERTAVGKDGVTYHKHSSFCFETQFYPNHINEPAYKGKVVEAGETFTTRTEFRVFQAK